MCTCSSTRNIWNIYYTHTLGAYQRGEKLLPRNKHLSELQCSIRSHKSRTLLDIHQFRHTRAVISSEEGGNNGIEFLLLLCSHFNLAHRKQNLALLLNQTHMAANTSHVMTPCSWSEGVEIQDNGYGISLKYCWHCFNPQNSIWFPKSARSIF